MFLCGLIGGKVVLRVWVALGCVFSCQASKGGFWFVCLFEEACRLLIADLALKLLLGWEGLLECSTEAVDFLKTVLNCLVSVGCSWELAKQRSAGMARLDPSPVVSRSTKSGLLYEELDGCCNCLCSFPLGVPIKGHYSHPVKTVWALGGLPSREHRCSFCGLTSSCVDLVP